MNRLIWILPSWIHDLILRLTGYRLVTFYPVQDNGKLRILWNKPRIIWTKNPVERGAL
jgi:hypothetical protein